MNQPSSLREAGQHRRQLNRESTPHALASANVEYTLHNDGAHLRVKVCDGCMADLWPGTGLWSVQHRCGERPVKGRGVFNLIRHIHRVEVRRVCPS